jgi:hypothetical protein
MRTIILAANTLFLFNLLMLNIAFCDDMRTKDVSHFNFRFAQPHTNNDSENRFPSTLSELPDYELLEEFKAIHPEKAPKKWWVSKYKELTERDIEDVQVQVKEWDKEVRQWRKEFRKMLKDKPYMKLASHPDKDIKIQIKFNSNGAEKFRQLTSKHKGNRLAYVLDNMVIIAPVILEEIKGGSAFIAGVTEEEAHRIADRIRAYVKK